MPSTLVSSTAGRLGSARSLVRGGAVGAALVELADIALVLESDPGALDDTGRSVLLETTLECRLARGEIGDALALGDRLGRYLEMPGLAGAYAHHGRGEQSAATAEPELAAAHFARVARLVGSTEDDPALLPWRIGAALAAVRLGHRVEGAALAREHLLLARSTGSAYATALGLRTLATVDARADRIALLREAQGLLAQEPAARLSAQLETDLAGLLLLGIQPGAEREALQLLRRAEAYAAAEHLVPLQGRIHRLLARLDQAPRPTAETAIDLLTTAEQRVARLAADGRTNREVAAETDISVKAVEWHLSHVYRKLGIRSRVALADALGL